MQSVRGYTICRGVNSDNKTPHSVQQFQTRAVMRDTPPPPLNSAAPSLQEAAPREKCTRQPSPNVSRVTPPLPAPGGPCSSSQREKGVCVQIPTQGSTSNKSFEASSTFYGCSQLSTTAQTSSSGLRFRGPCSG